MSVTAGQIIVDLTTGDAKFITQMKAASGSVKEFGTTARGELTSVRGGLELLKGDFNSSRLQVHALMELFPGLGKAMNAAFSGIAIIAVIGMLYEAGKKAEEFYNKIENGANKAQEAFYKLHSELDLSTAGLQVTNDKLQNDIDLLEHKPGNAWKTAIDEANEAALTLGKTLQDDLEKITKTLTDISTGNIMSFITGQETDTGPASLMKKEQLELQLTPNDSKAIIARYNKQFADWFKSVAEQQNKYEEEERNATNDIIKTGPKFKMGTDQSNLLSTLFAANQYQQQLSGTYNLSSDIQKDTRTKGILTDQSKGDKRAQTELKTYTDERDKLNARNFDNEIKRIDAEYHKELDHINELDITKKHKAELFAAAQVSYDEKIQEAVDKQNVEFNKSNEEVRKSLLGVAEAFNHQVVEAIKTGENEAHKFYEELHKALEDIQKIQSKAQSEQLTHNIEMVRSKGGTYRQELDLQYQDIMTRYNNSAKTAADALQANAEITKLNNEWTEALTKQRQETTESLKDEARNIIGGVSSQIGKAAFGDKTNFKQMFKGMGEQFVSTTLTKELTKAFRLDNNRLGATKANAMWVQIDIEGKQAFPGMNKRQIPTIVSPITTKFIPGMTGGGSPENDISSPINQPQPIASIGGNTSTVGGTTFHIDARGAELGVANRMTQLMKSVIPSLLHFQTENAQRSPQSSE